MKQIMYLISALIFVGCSSNNSVPYDLIISNVNLIDGTGKPLQTSVSIGIKEGRIAAIDSGLSGNGASRIDGSGKYLIPGLFDCHVHTGNFERDFPRLYTMG